MMTEKIVFLDRDTVAPQVNVRRPAFDHEWTVYDRNAPDQVAERLAGATIAITNKAPIREDTMAACPDLKMIAIAATGTDIVDTAAAKARGIVVSNIRGYAVHTVPEHTFALILTLMRAVVGYARDVADGEWKRAQQFCFFNHPIGQMHGSRLGIIGEGSIGSSVADIGRNGFGMEPVFLDHAYVTDAARAEKTFLPFKQFMSTADVISVHCPLTPDTENLLTAKAFALMKPNAIVVNTARGAVINEVDMAAAIAAGKIAGAAIDVLAVEPPDDDHPYMKLLDRPNFILTPHVAWASTEAMQTLADQLIDNVENFVAGRPSNVVG
jgi:glycerate dehydrogenase